MAHYYAKQIGTIANNGTSTGAINLRANCNFVSVVVPTLDSGTVKLQVSLEGTTYQDLGSSITTGTTTGGFTTTFKLGGFQFIKVVSSASQSAARTIKVRGFNL